MRLITIARRFPLHQGIRMLHKLLPCSGLHHGPASVTVRTSVTYHLWLAISCLREGFFVEIYETKRPWPETNQHSAHRQPGWPRDTKALESPFRCHTCHPRKRIQTRLITSSCVTLSTSRSPVDRRITTLRPQPSRLPTCIIAVPVVTALPTWDLQCRPLGIRKVPLPISMLWFIQG